MTHSKQTSLINCFKARKTRRWSSTKSQSSPWNCFPTMILITRDSLSTFWSTIHASSSRNKLSLSSTRLANHTSNSTTWTTALSREWTFSPAESKTLSTNSRTSSTRLMNKWRASASRTGATFKICSTPQISGKSISRCFSCSRCTRRPKRVFTSRSKRR